jgi:5-methylcytosine-specific restriction endonuclease McrA
MGRGYSFEVIRARVLFNERKPSARQLRAKRAAEKKLFCRCACCSGLFPPAEMRADAMTVKHIKPILGNHEKVDNVALLCIDCNTRFNQDEAAQHSPDSSSQSG